MYVGSRIGYCWVLKTDWILLEDIINAVVFIREHVTCGITGFILL